MDLRAAILALAAEHGGARRKELAGQGDLFGHFQLDGADITDFLTEYAERFGVDMSDFLWEFHFNADEPPHYRRVIPVGVDGKDIPWMPISLDQLVRAAEQGRWAFDYPEHTTRTAKWPGYLWLAVCAFGMIAVSIYHQICD